MLDLIYRDLSWAIIVLGSVFSIAAQDKKEVDLTVEIFGMKSDKGTVFIAVYNSEETFLKKKAGAVGHLRVKFLENLYLYLALARGLQNTRQRYKRSLESTHLW